MPLPSSSADDVAQAYVRVDFQEEGVGHFLNHFLSHFLNHFLNHASVVGFPSRLPRNRAGVSVELYG